MASKAKSPSPSKTEGDALVIKTIQECRREAEDARRTRLKKNKTNWDVYFGNVDWTHKQEGQSTEHLPKLSAAAEQMSAFVKRALVQFGDWFSVEAPHGSPLSPEQIRGLIRLFLENLALDRYHTGSFSTLMSDAVKQALMESLIILKVHGQHMEKKYYQAEPGLPLAGIGPQLRTEKHNVWRLRIDLIPSEHYYPDPTGRRLYEIHRVERDLFDVVQAAEDGLYDKDEVAKITEDFSKEAEEGERKARHKGQDESTPPSFRKRVVIDEFWGTLLGPDGKPIRTNCVSALANDKHLIRKPTDNPFWHGESPMIVAPIIRVPHSVQHKALYDDASALNLALDELFNLILDGGIASVWGVRQVREKWLADPKQVSGGIGQATTISVSDDAPVDAKVVETVTTGKVPPEAMAVLNLTDREMQAAMKTNDTRLGFLPPRQVKATELLQAEQSSGIVIDAFASDLETEVICKVLKYSWLNILQFAEDIPAEDVVKVLGVNGAFALSQMSPAERYSTLGNCMGFKAMGLSATLGRAREFQKFMALMAGVKEFPPLMESFVRRVSGDKILDHLMRSLNINPESMQMSPEELQQLPERVDRMVNIAQVMPAGATPGGNAASSDKAEVQQQAEPTGGF